VIPDTIIKKVLDAVDYEALIDLTSELVKINSVWDPSSGTGEQPVADYVAAWADHRGFQISMDAVAPGRSNVIIAWHAGEGDRILMFEGHTDVVTPGDVTAWRYDPFGAEIVDGRMYGRGTNDTKGNLAAMLIAMHALKKAGIKLSGSIIGGVLCDEEGQMAGVLDFIDKGHADKVTGAVICEPQDGRICTTQKGAIRACYSISGHMSHGAMPLTGINTAPAIARLIDGLHRLELDAVQSFGQDEYLGWPSFTPTVIQAPSAGPPQLNVVPGEARVLVDIRTIPGQHHDQIRSDLQSLNGNVEEQVQAFFQTYDRTLQIKRQGRIKSRVEFLTDRPCTETDKNDPIVTSAAWATRKRCKTEPRFAGVPGATDGTFLWALKQIPIVTMGAGDRHVPHQINEWVDVEQLKKTADIYALTALHYLSPGVEL
jgi:succinyl-diaminopimelate desuccinylase